jgi:hypothetical protein
MDTTSQERAAVRLGRTPTAFDTTARCRRRNPSRCSEPPRRRYRAGASWGALPGLLGLVWFDSGSLIADQFVEVDPGWQNTPQYSVTGAWGDYDQDGLIDLFVANCTGSWQPWVNLLYRNNGDGTFTATSAEQVGAVDTEEDASLAGYWGDFNNDGLLDLFVISTMDSATSPLVTNRLYLNRGAGGFASVDAGDLTDPSFVYTWGAVADYDGDGWLDVFVCGAVAEGGRLTNMLYQGRSDTTFRLVSDCVVATDPLPDSMAIDAVWGDYDNDGDQDLLVSNYAAGDFFYRNTGQGQFTRLTDSVLEQASADVFHSAWGDYDNDGFLDLAAGGITRTHLFRNAGGSDFLVATNWPTADWATPAWADYDNDGYLDLLVTRGQVDAAQLRLFHNHGDGTFDQLEDAPTQASAHWLGAAWGDYDNDGFMDLFVAETSGQNVLYHNRANDRHWLKFRLEGTVANRAALGAKVRVRAKIAGKTLWQMREVSGGNFCQNDLRPNFGLGDATVAEVVRIEWPAGTVQEFTDVAADQIVSVTEPAQLEALGAGRVRVRCWQGMKFELQVSNDLRTWSSLGVATNESGALEFTDPEAGQQTQRFYRAVRR